MCGIVGVAGEKITRDDNFRVQCDALKHRGPDSSGIWRSSDGTVALGHRRLAIIDLSEAGNQPMPAEGGDVQVVLNGEIYNYRELRSKLEAIGRRFVSASDTEVLLQAYAQWDTACLEHLNGMFAFAIYDSRKRRLFLARDRAGEKPLFYHHRNGKLAFASELKALLTQPSFPRVLNPEGLDHFLAYGYVPGDLCLIQGVHKLPPAHFLTYFVDSDKISVSRYWTLPEFAEGIRWSVEQLVDELEVLLAESVKLQLAADVPVGILLSGGIDSSLITALAARVSKSPVRTFTVALPGEGRYDEGPDAKLVAAHFGTRHTELVAEPATVDLLPELARQYDEPVGDSSMVPTYMVSKLIRQSCTVALGGDAGDELFGGYLHYSRVQNHLRWRAMLPSVLKRSIAGVAGLLPTGLRGRTYLRSLGMPDRDAWVGATLHFDSATRRRLAPLTRMVQGTPPESYRLRAGLGGRTPLQAMTRADFQTYLPEDILAKVDRASMLASLELRAPFLDYRIVEFAFGRVPDELRATGKKRKVLLRLLAERLLPSRLGLDRKQGFSLPLDSWFKGSWGNYLSDVLRSAPRELFAATEIESLLRQNHRFPLSQRLFNLSILELWRAEYNIQVTGH